MREARMVAALTVALLLAPGGCGEGRAPGTRDSAGPAGSPEASNTGSGPGSAAGDTALVPAAERIVAFLRREAPFDTTLFADTVTLHVSPEGGGESRAVSRDGLADHGNWTVAARPLIPPREYTELTMAPGRHLACMEGQLRTRSEPLARLPHVGTMLAPPGGDSCLQTWNLTLVFERGADRARLVAAVYDQWEW